VLSATDTVAAVSIVKEQKYPKLNSILFGEGVINDAVSIVLFHATENILHEEEDGSVSFGAVEATEILLSFLFITSVSIVIGVAFGLLSSILIKKLPGINEFPERETSLIIMMAYMSYIIAELLDISGIVTIFMCGLTMAHYTYYNLSNESKSGTDLSFNVLGQGAEAFTFAYLGLSMTGLPSENWSFIYLLSMLFATIVARAGSIFFSSLIVYGI
jgi:NhaP-type Na+/H+ or K+/H+ antiporter